MRIAVGGSGAVHQAPIPAGPAVEVLVGRDAGGALSVAEVTLPPGARMPEHAHGPSTALLVALSGELVLTSGEQQEKLSPGAVALLDRGEWVSLANETDRPVTVLAVFAPADFIQTFEAWPVRTATADAGGSAGTAPTSAGAGETLVAALEAEHREIDAGIEAFAESIEAFAESIEAFAESVARNEGRTEALQRAMGLLRRHIYVEEEFLFPPLRMAGLIGPIMVMLREHGELWQTMARLDALLAEGADANRGAVLGICRELLAALDRHNSKEEPIVYPQAGRALTEADGAELLAFLASGHMPEGWVCQGAAAR